MPAFEGGAPTPVTTGGSGVTDGRTAAIPVYVVSGGQAPIGQRARRVVVVTDGPVEGRAAVPVYDAGAGALYSDDPALPVYVVSGSLGAAQIVTAGLVAEYRFDDGSGTTLTDYQSGYNGTLGTGAANRPDWVAGGLDFVPGNADVVINTTMPDTVVLGALTVCVVAQLDTGSAFRYFLGKHLTNAATATPIEFRTSNAATPIITVSRANTATKAYAGPAGVVGAYRMYSVTYPNGNVDGAPTFYVGTTSSSGTPSGTGAGAATGSTANLRIGRRADGVCQMDGIIAYILIYNRALSAAEIAQNYSVLQTRLAARGITLP